MKLYVGNLSFDITERTLRELFEPFGTVSEVKLIMDRVAINSCLHPLLNAS